MPAKACVVEGLEEERTLRSYEEVWPGMDGLRRAWEDSGIEEGLWLSKRDILARMFSSRGQ